MGCAAKYDWTRLGTEIIKDYQTGTRVVALSNKYGIPQAAISTYLKRQHVQKTHREKFNNTKFPWDDTHAIIISAYRNGESLQVLSNIYGMSMSSLRRYMKKAGFEPIKISRTCSICAASFTRRGSKNRYCATCIPNQTAYKRFQKYGMSQSAWELLLNTQNGTCAFCDKVPTVVDHDHVTNVVRGLLCWGHNIALGYFENDKALVALTPAYLTKDTGYRANVVR
jgi:hypothetical protein